LAILPAGLLEILINQPRSRRPDVPVASAITKILGQLYRLGEILLEIPTYDPGLGVRKPDIKMALEHDQNPLNFGIRYRRFSLKSRRSRQKCLESRGRQKTTDEPAPSETAREAFHGSSTSFPPMNS